MTRAMRARFSIYRDEAYIPMHVVHLLGLDGIPWAFPGSEKADGDDVDQARYYEGYYKNGDPLTLRSSLHL